MTNTENQKELDLEKRLKSYERIEGALRNFFGSTDFCYNHCFSKKQAVIGWDSFMGDRVAPGLEGCCYNKYKKLYLFDACADSIAKKTKMFEEDFQKKQQENVKNNFQKQGSCEYHTEKGCAIEKFRSPICNSWICPDYQIYLSNKFNIQYSGRTYSDNIVKSLLSPIYGKDVNSKLIDKTITNLKKATKRIENHKKEIKYKKEIKI